MSLYYENLQPQAEANYAVNGVAFATNKPATFGSTVAITGALTQTGAATFASTVNITGALTVTGAISGPRVSNVITSAAVGATVVLTAAQTGSICINASTSGSPAWTLPALASGLRFTFTCANTTAGFTVNTGTTALIHAKTSATGTAITSTATTGTLINTQATAVVGDAITIFCDGTGWFLESQTGIFSVS